MATQTKVFFATDIHGSDVCFRKFLNAGKHYDANVLICGADITGKQLVPIVRQDPLNTPQAPARTLLSLLGVKRPSKGTHKAYFSGRTSLLDGEEEVAAFEHRMANQGVYTLRLEDVHNSEALSDPKLIESEIAPLIQRRVSEWVELADERLKGQGRRVFVNAGNDDPFYIDDILDQSQTMQRPEGRVVELDGFLKMISTGYANQTPWNCHRDIPEVELKKKIDLMAASIDDFSQCIFNLHCPPADTELDQARELKVVAPRNGPNGRDLQPQMSGLGVELAGVGSTAVREAILQYQPCVGLHGHIHESRGRDKLGRTLCFNPGSEYEAGVLHGALLVFEDGVLVSHSLTSG